MIHASGRMVTLLPQADYTQMWLTDELLRTAFLQQDLKGALIPSSFGMQLKRLITANSQVEKYL